MNQKRYLTAKEATVLLEVSITTLYAYVSRGLIRSEAVPENSRERRYLAEDVKVLADRKAQRRDPAKAAQGAMHWGAPILESALTLITDHRLYYRGRDACELAQSHTFEDVATLLWIEDSESVSALFGTPPTFMPNELPDLPAQSPMTTMQIVLALAAEQDLGAYNLTPGGVRHTGVRILWLLTYGLTQDAMPQQTIAATLARAWKVEAVSLLDAALILCADHELNASSFTARVIASTDANPYAVVCGGLAALQGRRHGGHTRRVSAFLRDVENGGSLTKIIREWLGRGDPISGFGHRLYPGGDPRAITLLKLLDQANLNTDYLTLTKKVIQEVGAATGEAPTIDFALAVLERMLNLPADSALMLFALGRTAGWIGHAIEQYQAKELIRPRAKYVGQMPSD